MFIHPINKNYTVYIHPINTNYTVYIHPINMAVCILFAGVVLVLDQFI